MNVLVKPSTKCCDFALSSKRGGPYASDGWHAAIRGLVTTCYAFVKESFYKLETHVQPRTGLVQTIFVDSLPNLSMNPGLKAPDFTLSPCDERLRPMKNNLLCVRLLHASRNRPDKTGQFSCYGGNRHIGVLVFYKSNAEICCVA